RPREGRRRRGSGPWPSAVRPVIHFARRCLRAGPERRDALLAELLHVFGPAADAPDPLAEPGLRRRFVAGDRVPVEVEAVVAVVGALDVRRMGAPRLGPARVDDPAAGG